VAEMKWWGWGPEGESFTIDDKPDLGPFIADQIGVDVGRIVDPPPALGSLTVPESRLPDSLRAALVDAVGDTQVSVAPGDRIVHARGKSIRDLIRQRRGDLPRVPDAVVRPADEVQAAAVLAAVLAHEAVVIPFGGGSSISGSLEPSAGERRPVISLDLARLDQVLEIDEESGLARVQAGVLGPALEAQLQQRGWTLGHYPDSFTYSSLGGWIATRSSGMQSDRYGDIADVTKGLRVLTPDGTLVVRPIPAMSTGPSIREMILGSEGRLGIITEATIQIRRLPEQRLILGYLFPAFADGLHAMREIAQSEHPVSISRVSDANETAFSFAMRTPPSLVQRAQSAALQTYLSRRLGWDLGGICLAFIGYEGSRRHVSAQRFAVGQIVKRHGGLCIGAGPGALYDQKKFDTPYIRDFLLDRGAAGDVSETAMAWSRLEPAYEAVSVAARGAFDELGVRGYLMCHLSHSYLSGACLYFTFAFATERGDDMLAQYDAVKRAIQQSFVDNGATLSHHHAVGTEHAPWLEQDVSAPGVTMLSALFDSVDPGRQLNPGKITET
jgi:alkyldihydroxyacetonephosphate synthase